jgi:GTP pyrophosphokinase
MDDKLTRYERDRHDILAAWKKLYGLCLDFAGRAELRKIRQAFDLSLEAHKNVRRKSGEPYILHPLAVAEIAVSEIGLRDPVSVMAALLHDVVEDTEIPLEDIRLQFGEEVTQIVDGLTKISAVIDPTVSLQAENFRKMLLTMSNDIRVALVKVADRLHNMRTLDEMKPEKQLKIASETSFLYAPLAHRLGLYDIKSELEDLSMKYREPQKYLHLAQLMRDSEDARQEVIDRFIEQVSKDVDELGLKARIFGRVKSFTSIDEKIARQGIRFEDIYDIFAIRIVLDVPEAIEKEACFKVYLALSSKYFTSADRFRDWISKPKPSGYEALHLTVMNPEGRWIEVQIRSERMDYAAEKGLAAHWRYKDPSALSRDELFERWVLKIREMLESHSLTGLDFVQEVRSELTAEQIFVFTPRGEAKTLPAGASVIDFAYAIHAELGNTCIGAKVNNQIVPLTYQLRNGDQVEILTSARQKPQPEWLEIIKTRTARTHIKDVLKAERLKDIALGKKLFDRQIALLGIDIHHPGIRALLKELNITGKATDALEELYHRLGTHRVDVRKIKQFITDHLGYIHRPDHFVTKTDKGDTDHPPPGGTAGADLTLDPDRFTLGADFQNTRLLRTKCCTLVHGDPVMAFARPNGIEVHRQDCPRGSALLAGESNHLIKAVWSQQVNTLEFLTSITIKGHDKKRMLIEIIRVISVVMNINMRSLTIDSESGLFEGTFKVYVKDVDELQTLLHKLRAIPGVTSAERTN